MTELLAIDKELKAKRKAFEVEEEGAKAGGAAAAQAGVEVKGKRGPKKRKLEERDGE